MTPSLKVLLLAGCIVASVSGCDEAERAPTPTATGTSSSPYSASDGPSTPEPSPIDHGADARAAGANELGVIPVLMYHRIAVGGGEYDRTPKAFRAELKRLYREGYRPVTMIDAIRGRVDLPAGTSPVVLTFDDSSPEQFAYKRKDRAKPDSAVGILLSFARSRPDFEPVASFYVNQRPFRTERWKEMLRDLDERGFELGNHTYSHANLAELSDRGVKRELALGARLIRRAVPDVEVETLALPLGIKPDRPSLLRRGAWRGIRYEHRGILLVGAGPMPSPHSRSFDRWAIPRIRSSAQPASGSPNYGSGFWLDYLKAHPEERYVSDGDPSVISFPARKKADLKPGLTSRAKPYRR